MSEKAFSGSAVVVTGAGSGIGRSIALAFAERGASIAVLDRDRAASEATVDLVHRIGGKAISVIADICDSIQVEEASRQVGRAFGKADVLVNNSGIFVEGDVLEVDEAAWRKTLDVNVSGMFLCMKYFVPMMIKNGGGVVVNIGSEAGIRSIGKQVAYNVSKAAVVMLTKSSALDLATRGVRVNCVCPGRVLTPLVQKIIDGAADPQEKQRELSSDRPVGHMGRTEEIAQAVLFLASAGVSYATGSVLSIDGGFTVA